MNKLDRLYKKALLSINNRKEYEQLLENVKEMELWTKECQKAYSEGNDIPMTENERKKLDALIQEFEECYG